MSRPLGTVLVEMLGFFDGDNARFKGRSTKVASLSVTPAKVEPLSDDETASFGTTPVEGDDRIARVVAGRSVLYVGTGISSKRFDRRRVFPV